LEEEMTTQSATLGGQVTQATGQNPFRCYQCGNCSAGCPMAGRGDLLPHQVFRHLQLGLDDPLRAVQPWLCVGCQTCATRCPQELDLSLVMDFLRAEAIQRGTVPRAAERMAVFNHVFLNRILSGGRLREVELGALFNLYTRSPLQNVMALPSLLRRGKIRLGGKSVRGPGEARRRTGRPA
jgi:heterodisulfide reductase subunit C